MKITPIILTIASMFGLVFSQKAQASEFDKKTIVTFSQPMEIPGRILPAGEYVIKRADRALPDVVRFTNADEDRIYATVFALPTYRSEPTSDVVIVTEERRANAPEAIKKWFYPGDIVGAEFVYPKSGPTLMAMATEPSMTAEPAGKPSDVKVTEKAAPTPEPLMTHEEEQGKLEAQPQEPVEIAQATRPSEPEPARTQAQPAQQAEPQEMQAPAQEELPQTASSLPMASFWGGLAILGGIVVRRFSRRLV